MMNYRSAAGSDDDDEAGFRDLTSTGFLMSSTRVIDSEEGEVVFRSVGDLMLASKPETSLGGFDEYSNSYDMGDPFAAFSKKVESTPFIAIEEGPKKVCGIIPSIVVGEIDEYQSDDELFGSLCSGSSSDESFDGNFDFIKVHKLSMDDILETETMTESELAWNTITHPAWVPPLPEFPFSLEAGSSFEIRTTEGEVSVIASIAAALDNCAGLQTAYKTQRVKWTCSMDKSDPVEVNDVPLNFKVFLYKKEANYVVEVQRRCGCQYSFVKLYREFRQTVLSKFR